ALGLGLESTRIRAVAKELLKTGQIVRGFIGISYLPLTPRQAIALGLPAAAGITVQQVVAGSPAAQAGLRQGDVLTKVNDQQIDQDHPLTSIMVRTRPGDKVRLTV